MVLHIIINFIVVAPRPPSGKDQLAASLSLPPSYKSRLSKCQMQLVMGSRQYIKGDQSLAMGLVNSRCYKNKTRYFCSDFTKDGARNTQFSKSFPHPTKSRLSKYLMQLVMGLVNSRRSNNKKSSLCSDFAKNGAKRELFLLFIELSQSNRAPSQAEKAFTQMLL